MTSFFICDESLEFLQNNDFTSLIVLPHIQVPLQSLLQKNLGKSAPYSVSLKPPKQDSTISKVLLFCPDYGLSSQIEKDLLVNILERFGCNYLLLTDLPDDVERFSAEYRNSLDFDLIWITSHGQYDHYNPHHSKLEYTNVHGEQKTYDLSRIINHIPNRDKRRLLVSNVCDGGVGATLGGLAELGMGPMMVNENQALISYQWPVEGQVAVAFGALILTELLDGTSFFKAYQKALSTIIRGEAFFTNTIQTITSNNESHVRFINPESVDWTSILRWGSPVFLE